MILLVYVWESFRFKCGFEELVLTAQLSCREGGWCSQSTATMVGEPSA